MNIKKYLPLKKYIYLLLIISIYSIGTSYIEVDFRYYLFFPVLMVLVVFFFLIRIKNKTQRNIVKSFNDSILFFISAIITTVHIPKIVLGPDYDVAIDLMNNQLAYLLICIYISMLSLKSYIAILEFIENKNDN
ncbi:hypothetical protein KP17_20195 [Pectobacterium parvum]|nr:hypothetical protein KP17_20195 [Pectobacterium parvum]GKW36706.1 hypothetical protein PEC301875_07300 [Pectobacterium carotovorum subsp. carotovorum]